MMLDDSVRRLALLLAWIGLVLVAGCAGARRAESEGVESTIESGRAAREAHEELPGIVVSGRHIALSGTVRVTVAAPDQAAAQAARDAAFAVADSIEKLISPHVRGSEVGAINAAAGRQPVRVSPWTEAMIAAALEWAEHTGGAFDPTVGPLVSTWGFGGEEVRVPDTEKLEAARRLVGWSKVKIDPASHAIFLSEPGMELDLRGLAKGFALARMQEAMIAVGATSAIVDFDGDLLFFGPGTESSNDLWPIEVIDPYDPTRAFARFELPAGSVSTSAYYDRAIEIKGLRYGHLIDPRTGWPSRGLASVTVYAADAVVNDILSTGLFVMGAEEGLRLAETLHDVEAMFVVDAEPGAYSEVLFTAGMRRYLKEMQPPFRPLAPEDE